MAFFYSFFLLFLLNNSYASQPLCIEISDRLDKKIWDTKTKDGTDLKYILKSGMENPDSKIGCYAANKDSYFVFSELFNNVVELYHHKDPLKTFQYFNTNPDKLNVLSGKVKNTVISTRIRVIRNLSNFNFPAKMTKKDRIDSENIIVSIFDSFEGDLKGKYYSLSKLSDEEKDMLTKEHLLFQDLTTDKYLTSAGIADDYPIGRGIFISNDKHLAIWVNEEDHLRITSIYEGYDFYSALKRIDLASKYLQKKLSFAIDKNLGYLASCPTNIGTGMRASIMVDYPKINNSNLTDYKNKFKEIGLQIRGANGENSSQHTGIYDISNSIRLGKTEVELINDLHSKLIDSNII